MSMEHSVSGHDLGDSRSKPRALQAADDGRGLIDAWICLGLGSAEKVAGAWFGTLRDVQVGQKQAVVATLDFAENLQQNFFRVARGINERTNQTGQYVTDEAERITLLAIAGLRRTTRSATGLASEAATSIVGRRTPVEA
jgi:hypothetical protein